MEDKKMNESLTLETMGGFAATDEVLSLEEGKTSEKTLEQNLEYDGMVTHIQAQYNRAKERRWADENRWIRCWNNYRGIYGDDIVFEESEKSRVFIKITKTKVLASFAQITDILFSTTKFPIGVESTPVPKGILETVHYDPAEQKPQGTTMEQELQSGTITRESILEAIGYTGEALKDLPESVELKEGPGLTPTSQTYEPAKDAARQMEKKIHDQLEESNATREIHAGVFDLCLFGSLVFKGPFAKNKEYAKWSEDGEYDPVFETIPEASHVSVWNAYPDPDAKSMADAEFFIERHRLNKTQLRALKKRPYFRAEAIENAIKDSFNYVPEYWEHHLVDSNDSSNVQRFEILEYWGVIDKELAEEADMEMPDIYKDVDEVQINVWVCNGHILRMVLNPFKPARIPYYIVPYELNPFSIFGIGVAENMEDTQQIMNGSMRNAIDNAVISSNVILEVNEMNLVPGQSLELHPGKTFRTQGQIGQSIHPITIPNVTQDWFLVFDKARQLADEATGMPSYSHGVSGVMSTGRTASGMQMLMGAAKENIKSVVRNLDVFLFVPLGQGFFSFNMQFNFDKKFLVGDLEIVARGTTSLMRNEIRGQKLLQFYQLTSNPTDAAFTKRDYILREIASTLDLDPEKIVNDPRAAAVQAQILAEVNKIMGINAGQMGASGSPPGLADSTGTGMGGPGQAPEPGAEGYTGGGGGNNNPQGQ